MEANVISSEECSIIRLSGRFDAQCKVAFLDATEVAVAAAADQIRLDFECVDYLDSTGLGLLLMFRERARSAGKTVSLVNARGCIKQVLDIANFAELFVMT